MVRSRALATTLCLTAGCTHVTYEPASPEVPFTPPEPAPAVVDGPRLLVVPAVETATVPPPPISGGTLAVDAARGLAIAADPDRDRVSVVDLRARAVRRTVALPAGAEPGRVDVAPDGRVFVALRSARAFATFSLTDDSAPVLTPVCPAPRGLAVDVANNRLWVACAGGELVSRSLSKGDAMTSTRLEPDLRDVTVSRGHVFVTTFRLAAVREIDPLTGAARRDLAASEFSPSSRRVAWRAIASGDGVVALVQQHLRDVIQVSNEASPDAGVEGYGQRGAGPSCSAGVVHPTLARYGDVAMRDIELPAGLIVDFDRTASGDLWAALGPGDAHVLGGNAGVFVGEGAALGRCAPMLHLDSSAHGERVAVRFVDDETVVVQSREPAFVEVLRIPTAQLHDLQTPGPARVQLGPERRVLIDLGGASRSDTGHMLFHAAAGAGLACASCHPEGGDDGHVWRFPAGPRRTPSLRGGVSGTEPLHWEGDLRDFEHLSREVFTGRMRGPTLDADHAAALQRWVDTVPTVPASAVADPASVARGDALFHDAKVACASCHAGPFGTNNQTLDVGTGGAFQVPSLRGLWLRAPYQHDGCAATLAERFSPRCATVGHGLTQGLDDGDIRDLAAYLGTL